MVYVYNRFMNVPFSPPRIDELTIEAVAGVLRSGWITTGPKTLELEDGISALTGGCEVVCLNSWTNACELVLRWFGVGEGDEVIVPAYTYAATANIVVHTGAKPVMVDCAPGSCHVTAEQIAQAMSAKTKVVMPVDVGGLPVDYEAIMQVIHDHQHLFNPVNEVQKQLNRVLFLSDAAHSFGATYKQTFVGRQADVTGYSFHAVKNLTTAEGGAVVLNLPAPFNNASLKSDLKRSALHGQSKDALAKTVTGGWRYDIVEAGYKCNLTDIHAAIGCVELARYSETLDERRRICERYNRHFAGRAAFICPVFETAMTQSAYHLYQLRIKGYSEHQRDALIDALKAAGIAANVHFQPLPSMTFYRSLGYRKHDYPNAYDFYSNEISLPVWYGLSNAQIDYVAKTVIDLVPES